MKHTLWQTKNRGNLSQIAPFEYSVLVHGKNWFRAFRSKRLGNLNRAEFAALKVEV